MRLPIVLMLLTVLLLPADLRGLADQLQSGAAGLHATATRLLQRSDAVQVAETTPTIVLDRKAFQVR